MKHYIRLEKLMNSSHRLTFEFDTSLDVFRRNNFFVEYEEPLQAPREEINAIPFAAVMAPIASATGAKLVLPVLDEEYARALERCTRHFEKLFAKRWAFGEPLEASFVRNVFSPTREAMLFSGGLDSLTTYIRHQDRKPFLFTVFGADIPLSERSFIALCKQKFDDFSLKENAPIKYIHTDAREILNLKRLKRYSRDWYGEVSHGLMLSSLVAPAAYDSVQALFVPGCSHRPNRVHPCGSQKELIQEIRWGGTRVELDNHGLSRGQKVRQFFKPNPHYYSYLRVCWTAFQSLNCGRCEKCLRTICELLMNGIDPALCNFKIDDRTLPALKKRIEKQYYTFFQGEVALDFWRTIQENIRLDEIEDRYGARDFFRWLAGFEKIKERRNPFLVRFFSWMTGGRTLAGKWRRSIYEIFGIRRLLVR